MKTNRMNIAAAILLAISSTAALAAKGGNGGGGNEWSGPDDPVFTAESVSPYIPEVESHSLDDAQVVFYHAMFGLSSFEGTLESGEPCFHADQTGTLVIHRESRKNPQAAELLFWFQGELESGDTATHSMTMLGVFDEPDHWPPTEADPVPTVTFEYWEFEAENRKAKLQDCAGSYDYSGVGPWTVTVTRLPDPS